MNSEISRPSSRLDSIPLQRRDGCIAAALLVTALLCGASRLVVGVCGTYHDDAIYVSTAKALAQGEGYRLINLPGSPVQTKYPILYPALLSIVWRLWPEFPANLLAMQGLSLLASATMFAIAYLYLVRFGYFSRGVAACSGLLCATAPFMLYASTQTLSEMPFALVLLVALWMLERHLRVDSSTRRKQLLLGAMIGMPFLLRSIGVALIPAALLVLHRARRPIRWVVCGSAATTLPWIAWTLGGWGAWNTDPATGYYADYAGWWTASGLPFLRQVFLTNLVLMFSASTSLGLEGLTDALHELASPTQVVLPVLLGLLLWFSVLKHLRSNLVLPCCLAVYALPILICPWPPQRFLLPVLPILVPYLLQCMSRLYHLITPFRGRAIIAAMGIGIAVASNVTLLSRHFEIGRRLGYPYVDWDGEPYSWRSYQEVFDWLRMHAQPEDIVASGLDSMIYLYTDLRAFRPYATRAASLFYGAEFPPLGTTEELAETLRIHQPRYLVQMPMPGFSEDRPFVELIDAFKTKYPGRLAPVYQSTDRRFVVFEIRTESQAITHAL